MNGKLKTKNINKINCILFFFIVYYIFLIPLTFLPSKFILVLFIVFEFGILIKNANKKLIFDFDTKLWLLLIALCFLNIASPYNINRSESFRFIIYFLVLFLLKIILSNFFTNFYEILFKLLITFSAVFVLSTLIQIFIPTDFITNLAKFFYTEEQFQQHLDFLGRATFNNPVYPGITYQVGINGFFISIFVSLVFIKLLYKKNLLYALLLAVGIFSLYMVGQRGYLIFNFAAILIIGIIHTKNKFKLQISMIVGLTFAFIILYYLGVIDWIVTRFIMDADSGRFDLYGSTWSEFLKQPLIGNNGIGNIKELLDTHTHNIYLQILSELGIFGFILIVAILINNLFLTIKLITSSKHKESKLVLFFSLYQQLMFILIGMIGNSFYDTYQLAMYFLAIALLFNLRYNKFASKSLIKKS